MENRDSRLRAVWSPDEVHFVPVPHQPGVLRVADGPEPTPERKKTSLNSPVTGASSPIETRDATSHEYLLPAADRLRADSAKNQLHTVDGPGKRAPYGASRQQLRPVPPPPYRPTKKTGTKK